MTNTVMGEALARAGVKTPKLADARLRDIAIEILKRDGTVTNFAQALEADPEATLCLFTTDEILARAKRYLRAVGSEVGRRSGVGQDANTKNGQQDFTRSGMYPNETRDGLGKAPANARQSSGLEAGHKAGTNGHRIVTRRLPGHAKPRSPEAQRAVAAVMAKSAFDRHVIRGRPLSAILYGELERSAQISLGDGLEQLRQAALQNWLFTSVPYNVALRDVAVREWADEAEVEKFEKRWADLMAHVPKLNVAQIAEIFQLERKAA